MFSLNKKIIFIQFIVMFMFCNFLFPAIVYSKKSIKAKKNGITSTQRKNNTYKLYVDFFEQVYKIIEENYYKNVSRDQFNNFIDRFNTKIYAKLKNTKKSENFIKWRSAALLVDSLKTPEDIFSAFYPPKPAKEYEQKALDKRKDLGIKGRLIAMGYEVSFVEPRSDAYVKGLRKNDLIIKIGSKSILKLKIEKIEKLLTPLVNTKTEITYLGAETKRIKKISVLSKEYFKQSVFPIYMNTPGIYGLDIKHFNRKTGEDVFRFLENFRKMGDIKGLFIDLRNNPGGPPLAARELVSFFLSSGKEFAYFQQKNNPKIELSIPFVSDEYKYYGPMVILINKRTGSASELFSGIMQKRLRAVLMGRNSAGQVMLKSMFHFDDGSMLLLIKARGHFPDGSVFSFKGLNPNKYIGKDQEDEMIRYAAAYLLYEDKKKHKNDR